MGNPGRAGQGRNRAGGQAAEYEITDWEGNPTRWFATQDPRGYLLAQHRAYPGYVFELIHPCRGYAFGWDGEPIPADGRMDPAACLRAWHADQKAQSIQALKSAAEQQLRGSPDAPRCAWDPAAQGPMSRDAEDLMLFRPHELAVAECRRLMEEFHDRPLILDRIGGMFLRRYEALTVWAKSRSWKWCAAMVPDTDRVTVIAQLREEHPPFSVTDGSVCQPSMSHSRHELAVLDPSAPGAKYWNHPDSRYSLTVPFPSCPASIITETTFRDQLRTAVLHAADAADEHLREHHRAVDEHYREVLQTRPGTRRAAGNPRQGSADSRSGTGPARH